MTAEVLQAIPTSTVTALGEASRLEPKRGGGVALQIAEEGDHGEEGLKMPSSKDLRSRLWDLGNNEKDLAILYLAVWFILNVVITLYCKALFSVYHFPYPMLMTAIHQAFTFAGVQICAWTGVYTPGGMSGQHLRTILWFSVVFTLNIWLSNASLMAVSVNLHQVVRTSIPLFTMVMSLACFNERYPCSLLPSIMTVIVGVAATVWGDMDFEAFGMTIVVLGCFLSSLKGIMTQRSQVGALGMSALDMLRYVSPLAVVQLLVLASSFGEVTALRNDENFSPALAAHLCALGCVAFFLNFVSFRSAALNSPLTLNIAGNVKQVLTSLLSIWIFGGILGPALAFGILVTALGAFWYSYEMGRWRAAKRAQAAEAIPTESTDEEFSDDGDDLEMSQMNQTKDSVTTAGTDSAPDSEVTKMK